MGKGRGAGFDLVRIAAALFVFVYHVRGATHIVLTTPLANHGNIGVPIFFALSGFLVYRPFLHRPVEPVPYLIRRTLRMAPAWLVAVVGVRLTMPAWGDLLAVVMWSLYVELGYYAVLPFLARAIRGHELPLLAGLAVVSYLSWQSSGTMVPVVYMPLMVPMFFWSFAPGMLLAVLERDHPKVIQGPIWLAVGVPLVVIGLLMTDSYAAGDSDPTASLIVVLGGAGVMGGLMRWQRTWSPLALCAEGTYSFYLWHAPVLNTLAQVLAPPAALVVGFLVTGAISVGTTVVFERPIRRWVNARYTDRPRPGPAPERESGVAPATG